MFWYAIRVLSALMIDMSHDVMRQDNVLKRNKKKPYNTLHTTHSHVLSFFLLLFYYLLILFFSSTFAIFYYKCDEALKIHYAKIKKNENGKNHN